MLSRIDPDSGHAVPLPGELPIPAERKYENGHQEKPTRKIAELKVNFGELTDKNFEQLRVLNYLNLPVMYSNDFYDKVISGVRYSKLAFVKDVLVAAISTKTDIKEDGTVEVYIMTVTVLKPYRRYGIATQLLE